MLNDVEIRLKGFCRTVFPDLPETLISSASHAKVPPRDAVPTITLVDVMDEEYGIELDLDKAEMAFLTGLLVRIRSQVKIF